MMFESVNLAEMERARERLDGIAVRTPVVRCDAAPAGRQVHLKLENLQPVGSFKLRPIANAVLTKPPSELAAGVWATSSGNSAIAVAWMARRLGTTATAVVLEEAPESKLEHLRGLGARIVKVPFAQWWAIVTAKRHDQFDGIYLDAVRDPAAFAGNATLGLEILEALPELDAIFVPFGGGGMACGIARAARELRRDVKIIVCELETAQPFSHARRAGRPVERPYDSGFVSGVGFGSVLPEMFPLANQLIHDTMTVTLQEVAAAIKVMAERNKTVAEGAGAIPVAAALSSRHGYERVCAVVSGGNLDADILLQILRGDIR